MTNARRESVVRLVVSLQKADLTIRELMPRCGLSKSAVYNWLEAFREAGMVHRPDWRPAPGCFEAVYAWGPGQDRSRPPPLGNTARVRRYRQRQLQKARSGALLAKILSPAHTAAPAQRGPTTEENFA